MGKTKLLINSFRHPASTCATVNWRKYNSEKQPMVDWTPEPHHRYGVKHSVGKVIPHSNLSRQETPCKFLCSTPWYFELQCLSCGCSSSMLNSSRSRWKQWFVFELTLYYVLRPATRRIDDTTTRNSDRGKARRRILQALEKLKVAISSWPQHQRTILKD